MFLFLSSLFLADAEATSFKVGWVLKNTGNVVDVGLSVEQHGPEKPPPDDGYTFQSADGSNWLGKLGLASSITGLVVGGYGFSRPEEEQPLAFGTGGALFAGGVLMLWLERRS